MSDRKEDAEWLKDQLVELLKNAMARDQVEHQACAKYAELLWKMLPKKAETDVGKSTLDEVREKIRNAKIVPSA
jgi:hypothetical protein